MIKRFLLVTVMAVCAISLFGQTPISNDYTNPTPIPNEHGCSFQTFTYDHTSGYDLDTPRCYRMYPGASSYFSFTVPESSETTVRINIVEDALIGIAFYTLQYGELVELKCDVFRGPQGELKMFDFEEYAGLQILGRFWKLGDASSGVMNICVSDEDIPSFAKVLSVNTTTYTPQQLVEDVLITGCLTATNIVYTGSPSSIGYFSNGIPGLDFESGVILSTGLVTDAVGPNSSGSTGEDMNTAGDLDLENIVGDITNDAAVLEFDFVPASDLLEFQYVFASDEYPEFANSTYNDVFAFLLSGGPEGYVDVNVALIPSTTTPVTINNVNDINNSLYYIDNQTSPNIEYDGMTVTLTATKPVTACETYHIKLAVADVFDGVWDSAVFLKASSFTSGEAYTVESFNSWSASLMVMRGCSNYIVFSRTDATPLNQPVPIEMTIGGTATPGVDYSAIPTDLEIPAGQQTLTVYFDAYDTGVLQGDETILLSFANGCPCGDEATEHTITIIDAFQIDGNILEDITICIGEQATISIDTTVQDPALVSIEWSTGEVDVTQIDVTPTTTTTYTCDLIYPCDTITLTSVVTVVPMPVVDLGPDFDVVGLTANLAAGMPLGNTGIWSVFDAPGTANVAPATNSNATATVDEFGDYTYVWTETSLAPNCVDSDTIVVTYYHIPTADFTASQTLCFGDNTGIVFTGTVVPGLASYQWDFGDASVISGNDEGPYTINFPTPGNHVVSVTVTESTVTVVNSINVYVPNPLSGIITVDNDPCFQSCGGRASIAVSGGTAPYSYSWPSSSNVVADLCAGDYALIVTDFNGCEYATSYTITEPTLLEHDTSYYHVNCFGENSGGANIWANGGTPPYTYLWSDGFNGGSHNAIYAGHYMVTVYDDNGCTNFDQYDILQPNLLQVTTSGDFELCENQSVNIVAQEMGGTGPYTFYWNNGDGTGYNTGPQAFNIVPHADVTYTVYVVDDHDCVSNLATSEVIVSPEFVLSLTTEDNTCYQSCDGSAYLGVLGGLQPFQFSWDSNGPYLNDLCAGLFTVTITDRIGCRSDTMFVINEPMLLQMNIDAEDADCWDSETGTATAIVIGGTPPYNYIWSNNNHTDTLIAGSGTYHLTVSDDNNCRVYGAATISSPTPITLLNLYNPTICIGGMAGLVAQASGGSPINGIGYYYYWTTNGDTVSTNNQFFVSPEITTVYRLIVKDDNGCMSNPVDATVYVNPPITIDYVVNSVNNVCLGDSTYVELDIQGGNGGPYIILNQYGQIVASPMYVSPTETTDYVFVVEDLCETPIATDSLTIYVHPLPEIDFSADVIEGCPGQVITFTALDTISTNTYVWDFGDDVFAFVKNPTHRYSEGGVYDISLEVKSEYGCLDSLTKEDFLEIFPQPYANFSASPEVAGILNPVINFDNYSEEALFYFWYYGDGDSTINFRNPQHYYQNMGEFEVMLVSENEYGCTDTAMRTVLIREDYTIYAPTAFTPNGDGKNDCFRICGNGIDPYSFSMVIYNRWGELVYSSDDFDPEVGCDTCGEGAWDGTDGSRLKGDKYLPNGVYYWYARFTDFNNIGYEHNGVIQLIR